MKISFKEWVIFILLALACFGLWLKFGYSQFAFVNLSVNKTCAVLKAEDYLKTLGVDPKVYKKAVIFEADDWADRYLQKTVGFKQEEEFIRKHNYELFYWKVRFFRQFEKEEYVVEISSSSGNILSFEHLIEDVAARETPAEDAARIEAEEFLKKTFSIDLKDYDFHEEKAKRYEKRTDYTFSWEKKGVYIPWKKDEGGAKLLIGATVAGEEIRKFYVSYLDVPEKFQRYIERELVFGEYLFSFYFLVFTLLVVFAISIVVKRKHTVLVGLAKNWYLYLGIILAAANLAMLLNEIQNILIYYPSSASLASFLGIYLVKAVINLIIISIAFILPGIAGESLREEALPSQQYSSFTHYLRSSFLSRPVSRAILFGYVLFFIMLGAQASLFYLGQKYLGVWKEWMRLAQFNSAYIPLFSAFAVGVTASFNEEVMFRIFCITWAKKYLKHITLAVIFSALVWGFGHSAYAIFPVWFRGVEVTIMGLVYGFIFVRYGIIPLVVAHYLFDIFWGVAAYILGRSSPYLFSGSIFLLALPLAFGLYCYFANKKDKEKEIKICLNKIQRYNLEVLRAFVMAKKAKGADVLDIRDELIAHNWDVALVDIVLNEGT